MIYLNYHQNMDIFMDIVMVIMILDQYHMDLLDMVIIWLFVLGVIH